MNLPSPSGDRPPGDPLTPARPPNSLDARRRSAGASGPRTRIGAVGAPSGRRTRGWPRGPVRPEGERPGGCRSASPLAGTARAHPDDESGDRPSRSRHPRGKNWPRPGSATSESASASRRACWRCLMRTRPRIAAGRSARHTADRIRGTRCLPPSGRRALTRPMLAIPATTMSTPRRLRAAGRRPHACIRRGPPVHDAGRGEIPPTSSDAVTFAGQGEVDVRPPRRARGPPERAAARPRRAEAARAAGGAAAAP